MVMLERVDTGGDLGGGSTFYITDQQGDQVALRAREARETMIWLRSFFEPLPSLLAAPEQGEEKVLRQIIEELLQIAPPGNVKNALWSRYQRLAQQKEEENGSNH